MRFDTARLDARLYYDLWSSCLPYHPYSMFEGSDKNYLDELKSVAAHFGYTPRDVDALLEDGYTTGEVEEMFYCGEL